jgi:hypothetical protein
METVTETLASTAHASGERVAIRAVEDYRRCEELQTTVWGPDDIVGIPLLGLVTAQDNGGIVLGAFAPGGALVGFVYSFPGLAPTGRLKQCSVILAVHPDHQNRNVGVAGPRSVSAGSLRPDQTRHGVVYAFSGADGEVLTRIEQPEPDTSAFFGFQDVDRFAPGDLNGDGVPEIYALGWLQDGPNGEQSAGRPWIFDGAKSVAAGEGVLLYEIENPDLAPSKTFGWSMSKTDYNKNGTPDLYIGTSSAADDPMYVFDGRDGSLLKKLSLPSSELQAR